jgi:hypothetical protein
MQWISEKRFAGCFSSLNIFFFAIFSAGCGGQSPVAQSANRASIAPQGSQPSQEERTSPEEAICRALKTPIPDDPRLAAKAYNRLFTGATEARLRELTHNPNPSIALQARWELRQAEHELPSDTAHADYLPGFLEGDFGLRAPLPWAAEFAESWYHDNTKVLRLRSFYRKAGLSGMGKLTFTLTDGKKIQCDTINLWPELHETSYGPFAPKNIEIAKEADKVFITINDQAIPVKADFFSCGGVNGVSSLGRYQVAATVRGGKAFVALYENGWGPLSLYCLERRSGKVIWHSVAWTAYIDFSPGGSGFWYSEAQLVCDDSKITVFEHGTYSGSCIESFDVRTGENRLRFSSRYWHCRGCEDSWNAYQRPGRTP